MLFTNLLSSLPVLLAETDLTPAVSSGNGPSPSFQWAIVLFFVILGLLVTLSPPKRTYEIKKEKN